MKETKSQDNAVAPVASDTHETNCLKETGDFEQMSFGNTPVSLWKLMGDEAKNAGLNASMHGLPGALRAKYFPISVLWILAVLASTSYCFYLIWLSFQAYLDFDVVTNVDKILEMPSEFPVITICSENPIMTEYGLNYSRSVLQANHIDLKNSSMTASLTYLVSRYLVGGNAIQYLNESSQQALGYTIDLMLITCVFSSVNCGPDDFYRTFDLFYGNCYHFNIGKNRLGQTVPYGKVTRPGWFNGLTLELYVGQPDNVYSLGNAVGVEVFIHNKSLPFNMNEGIGASVGQLTKIGIKRFFTERLPAPYTDCEEDILESRDSELMQALRSSGYDYRQIDCLQACFSLNMLKTCGCQDMTYGKYFVNGSACVTLGQALCEYKTYTEFFSDETSTQYLDCKSQCPLECDQVDYVIQASSVVFPAYPYFDFLRNLTVLQEKLNATSDQITYEQVKATTLSLMINYGDMSYVIATQDPKMVTLDLISSVGGTLGLFIGVSFLSFLEAADLLITLVLMIIEYRVSRRLAPSKKH